MGDLNIANAPRPKLSFLAPSAGAPVGGVSGRVKEESPRKMPQPPPIKKKLGEAAPPAKTSTTKLTTIQPAVPKIKTLGAEAESGICLKTTVLMSGIDGIKQRPEMSIKTISDTNGTTTAPPAAWDSA